MSDNINNNKTHANTQPEFYTPAKIREIIGCGKNAVYKLMKDENFPSVLIGKKYYVPKKEFERWYKENSKVK